MRQRCAALVGLALVALSLVWVTPALATVQRFALIAGNNRGHANDTVLQYAENDAMRVAQVLRDLGGFEPADIVLLKNEDATTLRRTLISLNERIRAAESLPHTETLLFVYYSGHADGRSLRLGKSELNLREFAQLVRGSSATFRLLVLDACRSGTLTRVKGGRVVAPFAIDEASLGGEGVALLTAASATEDAQESDQLRGSFFTHSLVSGLLGAADRNGDGEVVLEEAYQYAYHQTLAATSRTYSGTQHPTFEYELKGQGGLVLTRPAGARARRAELVFPTGLDFLVLVDSAKGQVVAEVTSLGASRTLSVAPGRYFVRGRAADHLLEGTVVAVAGTRQAIEVGRLERVEYARLVRKGEGEAPHASSVFLGPAYRFALAESIDSAPGILGGYRLDLESLGFVARLGLHTSKTQNAIIERRVDELELAAGIDHTLDARWWSLALGGGVGARLVRQKFDTEGEAPSRLAASPLAYFALTPTMPLVGRSYLGLDVRLVGYLQRFQASATESAELRAPSALNGALFFGLQL